MRSGSSASTMTKFGKHPEIDTVDLAAEAAMGALADARRHDGGHRRDRRGQPDERECRYRPTAAEADRPDRHPGVQRRQRLRDGCHRTAHRDHGRQGRRGRLRPGRRCREARGRRSARRRRRRRRTRTPGHRRAATGRWRRSTAGSARRRCRASSPRSAWSTATSTAAPASSCSPKISEKNHAHSTLNPLAAYQKRFTLEQIMNDVMIAYPNTRPMCSANCDGAAAAVVCSGEPS